MCAIADEPDAYIAAMPEDLREPVKRLRQVLKSNLPEDLEGTLAKPMSTILIPTGATAKSDESAQKSSLHLVAAFAIMLERLVSRWPNG